MDSHPSQSSESRRHVTEPPARRPERIVALVIIGLISLYALWTLRVDGMSPPQPVVAGSTVTQEKVPLTTGDEPITEIFVRAGCPVCHMIPGIPGADGRVGPRLTLGTTGKQRLTDPAYGGQATTVHDYVVESVLEPDRFVVPGYPERTMPAWYGSKLSALALEKIAAYLEQQIDVEMTR